jgi:hypothetical protein
MHKCPEAKNDKFFSNMFNCIRKKSAQKNVNLIVGGNGSEFQFGWVYFTAQLSD